MAMMMMMMRMFHSNQFELMIGTFINLINFEYSI